MIVLAAWAIAAPAACEETLEQAYREGRAALEAEDAEKARAAFLRALSFEPEGQHRFRMLLGMALGHEMAGDKARATAYYRAFLRASVAHPDGNEASWLERRARVGRDLERLEGQMRASHGRLELRTEPKGARVVLGGRLLPRELQTPVELFLAAGRHEVGLRPAGGEPVAVKVSVEAGGRVVIERNLAPPTPPLPAPAPRPLPSPRPAAPPSPPPSPDVAPPAEPPILTVVGASLTGVGGATLVVGGVLAGLVRADLSELEQLQSPTPSREARARDAELRAQISRHEGASIALLVTGTLMAGAGVTMLVLAGTDRETDVTLGPGWLSVRQRF